MHVCSVSNLERAYDGRVDDVQLAARLWSTGMNSYDRPYLTFNLDKRYDDAVKLRMWYELEPGTQATFYVMGLAGTFPTFQAVRLGADASGFTELAVSGTGMNRVSAKHGVRHGGTLAQLRGCDRVAVPPCPGLQRRPAWPCMYASPFLAMEEHALKCPHPTVSSPLAHRWTSRWCPPISST
jgi:hypothetical protein